MIKGALFDIDDTLYSHETEEVPKKTIELLDKLKAKGIKIGVCTSRTIAEITVLPEDLKKRLDCIIVGTGATTISKDGYFKSYTIDLEDTKKYISYFEEKGLSYHYVDLNGDLFYWGDLDKVNEGHFLSYAKGNVKFKPYEDEEVTNLFYYGANEEEADHIAHINPHALISTWGSCGNICTPLIDKSFGLLKFCQVFSLTTDEVAAAGDGGNDDVMLEMAGIGIAVSDAKENCKAKADYICKKSIENGGLYDAFAELGLIEEDRYDNIKMFVSDIDSTLFDHVNDYVHEEVIDVFRKLKEKGYLIVYNTSRSYEEMKNVPQELLELADAQILLNGAYVIKDGKIEVTYLPDEDVKRIIPFLDEHDVTYRYATDDGRSYLNKDDEDKQNLFYKLYEMIPVTKKYEGERILHLLYYAQGDLREEIISLCEGLEYDRLKIAGQISPAHKNKGEAMLQAAASYGVKAEEICAFGDNGNDLQMIEMAGLGIAMENGSIECRQVADHVCAPVTEEGVISALKHYHFI